MRNPFGWDYPAGAENDPNAPWNQSDEHHSYCPCHEDYDGPMTCKECEEDTKECMCWAYPPSSWFYQYHYDHESHKLWRDWYRFLDPRFYIGEAWQSFGYFLRRFEWARGFAGHSETPAEPDCRCEEICENDLASHEEEWDRRHDR